MHAEENQNPSCRYVAVSWQEGASAPGSWIRNRQRCLSATSTNSRAFVRSIAHRVIVPPVLHSAFFVPRGPSNDMPMSQANVATILMVSGSALESERERKEEEGTGVALSGVGHQSPGAKHAAAH